MSRIASTRGEASCGGGGKGSVILAALLLVAADMTKYNAHAASLPYVGTSIIICGDWKNETHPNGTFADQSTMIRGVPL